MRTHTTWHVQHDQGCIARTHTHSDRLSLTSYGFVGEKRKNWGSDRPLHTWYGVKCDSEGRVVGIELKGNNLQGAEHVRHRKHLLICPARFPPSETSHSTLAA
jgi:hypothetical protein